jgi:signal transduction histidine kinase
VRSRQALAERFKQGLEYLVGETRAEIGVVFHLEPLTRTISIVAQAGGRAFPDEGVYTLLASPVKDVIVEETLVRENRATLESTGRFVKLLALMPFESCIGVPIRAAGQTEHALFLFHRAPDVFSASHLRDALATAALFSAGLESQALDERIRALTGILLSGQLAAGFGHEVYNKLFGLDLQFRNLRTDLSRLARTRPGDESATGFAGIEQALNQAIATAADLRQAVTEFRQLMEAGHEEKVDVNRVLRGAEGQVRPLARRAKVDLHMALAPNLPQAFGSSVGLRQAFLNVMLNALQQMELKPDPGRLLEVTTVYQAGDKERPIKIRFSDTGPGIHGQLWNKVFEIGFTTRPGGSGLGLFITRSLVESMGGSIRLERSLVPLGTVFLVELRATDRMPA